MCSHMDMFSWTHKMLCSMVYVALSLPKLYLNEHCSGVRLPQSTLLFGESLHTENSTPFPLF